MEFIVQFEAEGKGRPGFLCAVYEVNKEADDLNMKSHIRPSKFFQAEQKRKKVKERAPEPHDASGFACRVAGGVYDVRLVPGVCRNRLRV